MAAATDANSANPSRETPAANDRRFQPNPLIESAGPDPDTSPELVHFAVGVVIGAHGLQGDLKVRPLTDDMERFHAFSHVYLGDEPRPRKIRGRRFHAGNVLLRLAGITNPEAGAVYRDVVLRVPGKDVRPLEQGEFFLYQLIGLEARTEAGELAGTVVDLIETGATDVFVIEAAGSKQQMLLPNLPDVILDINPAQGVMTVRPLEFLE